MRKRWEDLVRRLTPPGYDADQERIWLRVGAMLSVIVSLAVYSQHLLAARQGLYNHYGALNPDAVMEDFAALLQGSLWPFPVLAGICLLLAIPHGVSFYQGSRSIYLMRRLNDRGELWRRTLGLPLVLAAIVLVLAALVLVVFYIAYCVATPDVCQTPNQWAKLFAACLGG